VISSPWQRLKWEFVLVRVVSWNGLCNSMLCMFYGMVVLIKQIAIVPTGFFLLMCYLNHLENSMLYLL
jgi:hypothetical protein